MADVSSVLKESKLFSVDDFYAAFIINKRAKFYGVEGEEGFSAKLATKFEQEWLELFSTDSFSLVGESNGVTIQSLRLVEMMASLIQNPKMGERAGNKVKEALSQLIKQTSASVGDPNTQSSMFFIAPKKAGNPQEFDLIQANLHFVNILVESSKAIQLSDSKFKPINFSQLRDYFFQRAMGSQLGSLSNLYFSLRGLKALSDQVFLTGDNQSLRFDSPQATLTYQAVDMFGSEVSVRNVSKATLVRLDVEKEPVDVLADVEVSGSLIKVNFKQVTEMKWDNYALSFKFTTEKSATPVYVTKTFQYKLQIF